MKNNKQSRGPSLENWMFCADLPACRKGKKKKRRDYFQLIVCVLVFGSYARTNTV